MKLQMIIILTIFSLIGWSSKTLADDQPESLSISQAWVRLMPPGQKITAAFMTIENNSGEEQIVVSATSDVAEVTEMHHMVYENGMMKMSKLDQIVIAPHAKAELVPGGMHVMLINLKKVLAKGEKVLLTLQLKDGSQAVVEAEVSSEGLTAQEHLHEEQH